MLHITLTIFNLISYISIAKNIEQIIGHLFYIDCFLAVKTYFDIDPSLKLFKWG